MITKLQRIINEHNAQIVVSEHILVHKKYNAINDVEDSVNDCRVNNRLCWAEKFIFRGGVSARPKTQDAATNNKLRILVALLNSQNL